MHFASLILKMRHMLIPILEKYNAMVIFPEADNLWCVFPDTKSCTLAALECNEISLRIGTHRCKEWNKSSADPFILKLSGVGIHTGAEVLVDQHGKIWGPTVSKAFRLGKSFSLAGEDLTENANVLLTPEAKEEFEKEFPHYQYNEKQDELVWNAKYAGRSSGQILRSGG